MEIRGNTRVFGILGHPVQHSLSPLLHNMAFKSLDYPAVYIPLDVKETGPFLKRTLQNFDLGGLSVTIPHKIWAYRMADSSDPLSRICGASNTLLFKRSGDEIQIEARNSDGPGAIQALKNVSRIQGKSVVICGYGGSSRAIAAQLLISEKPAELWITGRNPTRIKSFIRDLKKQFPRASIQALEDGAAGLPSTEKKSGGTGKNVSARNSSLKTRRSKSSSAASRMPSAKEYTPENLRHPDILIQTTPLGMQSKTSGKKGNTSKAKNLPVNPDLIQVNTTVFDIVYSPMETPLLSLAKKKGCKVVYGYSMLLYQAAFQFRWFTGKEPPVERWEKLLRKDLKSKK